jgi:GNAT superfamily N-acetyltransferase
MSLHRFELSADADVDALVELHEAARLADVPYFPPDTRRQIVSWQRHGWDGEPPETWLLRDGDVVVGKVQVMYSERDNLHLGGIGVLVHPKHRRNGYGRTLAEAGLERLRGLGRRTVGAGTLDRPEFNGFAQAMGFEQKSADVHRRQDFQTLDLDAVAAHRAKAEVAASDYELLRLRDAVPDELIDDVAVMTAAINDAPTDDLDVEDEVFDAKRIREFENAREREGELIYRIVARRKSDGALAGHTMLGYNPAHAEYANQWDTSVLKDHRGHRLGMLLKASMVEWLREAEPTVRYLDTWNAESNSYMIAVNEALGYQVVERNLGYQRAV